MEDQVAVSVPQHAGKATDAQQGYAAMFHSYPTANIYTLLKLFVTLLLSFCSCECSASGLRQLNNYLRCTQTKERLSALAFLHCNYSENIDVDRVRKLFVEISSQT